MLPKGVRAGARARGSGSSPRSRSGSSPRSRSEPIDTASSINLSTLTGARSSLTILSTTRSSTFSLLSTAYSSNTLSGSYSALNQPYVGY